MKFHIALTLIIQSLIFNSIAEEKWISLFDGKSLEGWTQKGGKANYAVENNCIVGRTIPNTPNSFLCTEKD